ncbi:MAG: hypothetical protein HY794_08375 [Desulfarculus sp.]|nr:hypothetical protein [Desulfarculus sp.]
MGKRMAKWLAAAALVLAFAAMTQAQGPRTWWDKEPRPAPLAVQARGGQVQGVGGADYQRLLAAVEENSRSLRHEQLYRLMHQQHRGR